MKATELWRFSERDHSALAAPGTNPDTDLLVHADHPGALTLLPHADGGAVFGYPDPASGKLRHAVIPGDVRISPMDTPATGGDPQYTVTPEVLYTTAQDEGGDTGYNQAAAYDLKNGEERWRTKLPSPDPYYEEEYAPIRHLHLADDGYVYALQGSRVGDDGRLYRLDATSGKILADWELPRGLIAGEYELQVVDDQVHAVLHHSHKQVPAELVLAAAPPEDDERTPGPDEVEEVAPANGPEFELESLSARLPKGQRWDVTPLDEIQQGVSSRSAFAQDGYDTWDVFGFVTEDSDTTFDETSDLLLDSAKDGYKQVGEPTRRTIDGAEAFVVEAVGVRGGRPHEVDDLLYSVGTVRDGTLITLDIVVPLDNQEGRSVIESILASVRWR